MKKEEKNPEMDKKSKNKIEFNKPVEVNDDEKEPTKPKTVATAKNETLQELIEKNIKWSQVIYEQNRKIKRRMGWMLFGSYLRLAIIIIPLLLAIYYLPPIVENFWEQYGNLLSGVGSGSALNQGLQLNDIISQISTQQIQDLLQSVNNN